MGDLDVNEVISGTIVRFVNEFLTWITWPLRGPALDLVFDRDREPYLMTSHIFNMATGVPINARWYRVGVVNHWRSTIEEVRVTAERLTPPNLPGLPQVLHLMHDNPPPGTPFRDQFSVPHGRTPSCYVDVVSKVIGQDIFQLEHITPGVTKQFPAGRYEIVLLVRGRGTKSRQRTFILDLDNSGELRFHPRL